MRNASLLFFFFLFPGLRGATPVLAQAPPPLALQPAGGEILISVSDVSSRLRPTAAADRSGRFVVAWREIQGQDGGIAGRRLSPSGVPASPGFLIAPIGPNVHTSDPRIAARADGGFLVAWGESALLRPGCAHARTFSALPGWETVAGEAFDLGECTMENGRAPEVALAGLADGRFTAAWESGQAMAARSGALSLPTGSEAPAAGFGILVRQFTPAGTPLADPFGAEPKADGSQGGEQTDPAMAMTADGHAFVVWRDSRRAALLGRRFDAAGLPLGLSFRVDGGAGFPVQAAVAASLSGRSVAAWSSFTGREMRIVAQVFNAEGGKHGEPVLVSQPGSAAGGQRGPRDPAVAMDAAGNFVVVWDAEHADGGGTGVLGRLFDRDGIPQGPPFLVNVTRPGSQGHPAVAIGRGGRVLIVWDSQKGADGRGVIVGRLYLLMQAVLPSIGQNERF